MSQKACVVFVADMAAQADELGGQLKALGYNICLSKAALDDALAAQGGNAAVSPEIEACLIGADLKIFLVPAAEVPSGLIGAAGLAARMPGRLVAVIAAGTVPPQIFDDIANSVVQFDSPNLLEAIISKDVHESPDGAANLPKKPARVKCQ